MRFLLWHFDDEIERKSVEKLNKGKNKSRDRKSNMSKFGLSFTPIRTARTYWFITYQLADFILSHSNSIIISFDPLRINFIFSSTLLEKTQLNLWWIVKKIITACYHTLIWISPAIGHRFEISPAKNTLVSQPEFQKKDLENLEDSHTTGSHIN